MSWPDSSPTFYEPDRRSRQLPWRLELVLSALIVIAAGIYSPFGIDDPYPVEVAGRLWFALAAFFLWLTGLRILRDRSTLPSMGELLGFYPAIYWFVVLWAAWLPIHNGELALLLFMGGIPVYFIVGLISGGLLLATIAGKRSHVLYKFIDVLGLLVNIGGAAMFFIELWLHPPII